MRCVPVGYSADCGGVDIGACFDRDVKSGYWLGDGLDALAGVVGDVMSGCIINEMDHHGRVRYF